MNRPVSWPLVPTIVDQLQAVLAAPLESLQRPQSAKEQARFAELGLVRLMDFTLSPPETVRPVR